MSTASNLLKAREEYRILATDHTVVENRKREKNGVRSQLRFQAFQRLGIAYNEYVARHGQPDEEEEG